MWLDRDMQWYAPASDKRGRQQTFSGWAIEFCLSMKCLFGLARRQTLGLVQSQLRPARLDGRVPDFSTVSRRQCHLQVQLPYQPRTSALELLVDSTGIQFLGEGEWKRKKHGPEYRRQWRKVLLGIDARRWKSEASRLSTTAWAARQCCPSRWRRFRLTSPLPGDGAYDTKACQAAIHARGAQAVIPPRRDAQRWKAHELAAASRNEALRAVRRLGSRIWKKWSGYRRRSLVETKMHCFKRLGQRVMSRTFERQVVELHVRVALLNRLTQIGRPTTVAVAAMA